MFGDRILLAFLPVVFDHPDLDEGHRFPLSRLLATNSGIESV